LNAASASAANSFTLQAWSGNATLNGVGGTNTFSITPGPNVNGVSDVLSNSSLQVTGGVTQTIALNDIQTANLFGASKGANSFDVSGWTRNGSLTGQGTSNTLLATNAVALFTLSDTLFQRPGYGDLSWSDIQAANLTGGAGANTVLNVDDTGSTANKSGTLTGSTISGLTLPGAITYSTMAAVTIGLGSGNNTLTVAGTHAGRTSTAVPATTSSTWAA
jgi:hypothetical protein